MVVVVLERCDEVCCGVRENKKLIAGGIVAGTQLDCNVGPVWGLRTVLIASKQGGRVTLRHSCCGTPGDEIGDGKSRVGYAVVISIAGG